MNSLLARLLPWAISLLALIGSHTLAYLIGVTSTETRLLQQAYDAEDAYRRTADSLRLAVREATARVDTVTVRLPRLAARVDTAWLAVPDSLASIPVIADAQRACVALSDTCAEAQQLYAYERAARLALHDTTTAQLALAEQRARNAEARARIAHDKRWQRRAEGVAVCGAAVGAVWYLGSRQ